MSLFVYLDGVNVPVHRIRLRANGDQGLAVEGNADGTPSMGGIVFDDADGSLSVPAWRSVIVEEPDCTARRLFTGYVGDRTYSRGHYRLGAGREIDTTLLDANILLRMHRINGADSFRPEETDTARLAWLMASGYIPQVQDLGLITPTGFTFDAKQYKGLLPTDVLDDMLGPRDRIYFVYFDQTLRRLGLFYDASTATTFTSTLTISDVLSDVSRNAAGEVTGTCFPPYLDASSMLDPSEVYGNIRYKYKGAAVYRNNPTTNATFFSGDPGHRDMLVENENVGKLSTAIRFADAILARAGVEKQTISLTVQLPSSKVGLIDAGMRLGVRLSFVPGFTTLTYTRVESKTIVQTDSEQIMYDVGLTLSTFGKAGGGGTGGGSTDPYPHQPGQPGTEVQHKTDAGTVNMDFVPTDGNLLTLWMTERADGTDPATPAGWTSIATCSNLSIPFGPGYHGRLCIKTASGESQSYGLGHSGYMGTIVEWAGVTFGAFVALSDQNATNASDVIACGGAITPTAPNAIVVGCADIGTFSGTSVTPDAGVTELADLGWGGNPPDNWVGYKIVPTPVSTVVGGVGYPGARNEYGGVTFTLLPDAATGDPPGGGQPVGPETVVMVGDTGTTLDPFAVGSLRVFVDNTDQTAAIIDQDPAAGTFQLGFTPTPTEVVTVFYQGL